MKTFRLGSLLVLAVLACVTVVPVSGLAAEAQYILRYAGVLPVNHNVTQAQQLFARLASERTNGRLKIEVFPAGQLFTDKDIPKALTEGALDMGTSTLAIWTGLVPSALVSELTLIFHDRDHHIRFEDSGGGNILRREVENKGVKFINWLWTVEGSCFCTNKPIRKAEDFKALRIRSHGEIVSESLSSMGAVPVFLGAAEVYMALQRGTIDGTTAAPSNILSRKFHEVTKNITDIPGFQFVTYWVLVNKKKWDSLPPDIQKVILEAGQEAQKWNRDQEAKDAVDAAGVLKSKGKEIYTLPPAEVEKIRKAASPAVISYFLKRTGELGKTLLTEIDKSGKP
jgi:tripartite ATP-independent transporter DctP family solute receptor